MKKAFITPLNWWRNIGIVRKSNMATQLDRKRPCGHLGPVWLQSPLPVTPHGPLGIFLFTPVSCSGPELPERTNWSLCVFQVHIFSKASVKAACTTQKCQRKWNLMVLRILSKVATYHFDGDLEAVRLAFQSAASLFATIAAGVCYFWPRVSVSRALILIFLPGHGRFSSLHSLARCSV